MRGNVSRLVVAPELSPPPSLNGSPIHSTQHGCCLQAVGLGSRMAALLKSVTRRRWRHNAVGASSSHDQRALHHVMTSTSAVSSVASSWRSTGVRHVLTSRPSSGKCYSLQPYFRHRPSTSLPAENTIHTGLQKFATRTICLSVEVELSPTVVIS